MCGQLVFNFFNEASNMAMTSILGNASLIKKVYVPKYLFPLSRVCSSLVNMLTSFIALIIVIIVTRTPVTWTIITAVFPVLYVSMFAFGVGLVLATAVVTFRDLQHLYGVVITAWLYLTPIFYPISMLPESIGRLIKLNPITSFVELLRYAVLYDSLAPLKYHAYSIAWCVLVVGFGLYIFNKKQDNFILKL